MYAVIASGVGGTDVLHWQQVDDPRPGAGEVLIDVVAAGVNRADVWQREGRYPPPAGASAIIGLECSGTIAELGAGVTGWRVGDPVCALLSGGGYAEKVVAPATQLLRVPGSLDLAAAAALPEVACTAYSNLVMSAAVHSGQLVLIHGGGGGVGTHAIQLCKALGAEVAVTAGSTYKLERCAELGADVLINYRRQDFVAELPRAADIILDHIGGAYLSRNVDALNTDGQLILIGLMQGASAELNLARLLRKRGTIRATTLRGRPATGRNSKAEIVQAVASQVWPLVANGVIRPVVQAELSLREAGTAQELLDSPQTVGKVLLRTD